MKSPEDQLKKNLSKNAQATFYKGFNRFMQKNGIKAYLGIFSTGIKLYY